MNEDEFIHRMAEEWPEVSAALKPNHCIIAARVAVECGAYFGVPVEALAVDAMAFNGEAWDLYNRRVPIETWPETAWSVGAMRGVPGQGYDGHVIASSPRYWVDLSAAQFNRPKRSLDIPEPIVIEKPERFTGDAIVAGRGGLTVVYVPEVDGVRYRSAPDWRNPVNYSVEAAAMIRLLSVTDRTVRYPVGSEVDR